MKRKKLGLMMIQAVMICLGVFGMSVLASAQEMTINSVTPMPDRANVLARYEIKFTTSSIGALAADTDAIQITFPDATQMPSNIEPNSVFVDGVKCPEGSVFLTDNTLTVTPPNHVTDNSQCTILITQNAGIVNPQLSQEVDDSSPDNLYVLTVSTDKDAAGTIQYEIFDWVGTSPTELAHYDPCTIWGAGFMPGNTIHLNGLDGGPVIGSGTVGDDGTFQFIGTATGRIDFNLEATGGSGRSAETMGNELEFPQTLPPIADFTYTPSDQIEFPEESPVAGEEITFDAAASIDSDGGIVSWVWDFGDSNVDSGETITHSYAKANEYTVFLAVTDNRGAIGTKSQTLVVIEHIVEETDNPPVANAGPDQIVECAASEKAEVTLDASASTDPNDDPLTYRWNWESGSASGLNPTVTLETGTTTITLTVSDNEFTNTDDVIIIVKLEPTEAEIPTPEPTSVFPKVSFQISPNDPFAGEEITFDGSASTLPEGPIGSYDWSFGDGEVDFGKIVTHTYEDPGIYTVSLFIRDSEGNVFSYTTNTTIADVTDDNSVDTPVATAPSQEETSGNSGSSVLIWMIILIVAVIIGGVFSVVIRRKYSSK